MLGLCGFEGVVNNTSFLPLVRYIDKRLFGL